jgi:hypothetical protein
MGEAKSSSRRFGGKDAALTGALRKTSRTVCLSGRTPEGPRMMIVLR